MLIDIEILQQTFLEEVVKVLQPIFEVFDVLLSDFGFAVFNYDEWTDESTAITSDVDAVLVVVHVD